jgi:hypothetical protein
LSSPYLLTGIAICPVCGGGMRLRTGKNGRYRYYTCATQARQGKTACPGVSIAMDDLDRIVVEHLTDRIIVPERLAELLGRVMDARRATRGSDYRDRVRALEDIVREADRGLERLYQGIESGTLDPTESRLQTRIEELKAKRDDGRASIGQLTAPHPLETAKISPAMVRRFAERLRTELKEGNPALRKAYVKLFVSKVEVGRETIRIAGSEAALVGALDDAMQGRKIGSHIDGAWRPRRDGNPDLRPSH